MRILVNCGEVCKKLQGHKLKIGDIHQMLDQVRNEKIKERMKIEKITDRCVKARLRWFELVKRREQEYMGRRTLEMAPPGRRRGRPKQGWIDCKI